MISLGSVVPVDYSLWIVVWNYPWDLSHKNFQLHQHHLQESTGKGEGSLVVEHTLTSPVYKLKMEEVSWKSSA